MKLKAPFPWFGGKSRVAHLVWERFGDVPNYVEPFAGSLAVLLGRPSVPGIETVNDIDCYLANFWRAVQSAPAEVARWADAPVNEADLHARHLWLVKQGDFRERLKSDPEYCDAKIAGWWVWGLCSWIGSGWCAGTERPYSPGRANACRAEQGVHRQLHQKRPAVDGGHDGRGVHGKRPMLVKGTGVQRQLPDLHGDGGAAGHGVHASGKDSGAIFAWMHLLCARLRRVRVCCGDWKRIVGRSPTTCIGITAVFLDPPYGAQANRMPGLYAQDDLTIAAEVRGWAIEHGENPSLRIALCGYEGEHVMPNTWTCLAWKGHGGHGLKANGRGRLNSARERIWFSPHCLTAEQEELF